MDLIRPHCVCVVRRTFLPNRYQGRGKGQKEIVELCWPHAAQGMFCIQALLLPCHPDCPWPCQLSGVCVCVLCVCVVCVYMCIFSRSFL